MEPEKVLLMEDGLNVKATVALEMLLGTQGWRRFVEQNEPGKRKELLQVYKDDAQRFFAS